MRKKLQKTWDHPPSSLEDGKHGIFNSSLEVGFAGTGNSIIYLPGMAHRSSPLPSQSATSVKLLHTDR
jgi:hypothetical protein